MYMLLLLLLLLALLDLVELSDSFIGVRAKINVKQTESEEKRAPQIFVPGAKSAHSNFERQPPREHSAD